MTGVLAALGVCVLGIALSLILARFRVLSFGAGLAAVMLSGCCCVAASCAQLSGGSATSVSFAWPLPLGSFSLQLDGLSAWFLLIIGVVSCAAALYSWGYYEGGRTAHRAYAPLFCTLLGALVLVVTAADIVVFLTGWEIMSLSAFLLVGLRDDDAETRRGAWMYLIATHLGTAFGVLPMLGAFVARSGGTQMSGFAGAFGPAESGVCIALFALGVLGFGAKAGFMPMHVWLPAAHPVAPSPISALMSGVVIKTGIYGLLRLISWMPELPTACAVFLIVLSLVTALLGILHALAQRQIKRMLAYSSVENIGIIGLAIGVALLGRSLGQPLLVAFGLGGALLHTLNHALFKGLLFLSAGTVLHAAGTGDIERLGGLSRSLKSTSLAFLGGAIAISALPPLNGFVGEYVLYNGLLLGLSSLPLVHALLLAAAAAVLALTGAIALAAFSKVFAVVFLGEARDPDIHAHQPHFTMTIAPLFLLLACVAVVAFPGPLAAALGGAMAPLASPDGAPGLELAAALETPAALLRPFGLLIVLAAGLYMLRRLMPRGVAAPGSGRTWGCGYPAPVPSMQYSGASYAWKLLSSFRQLAPVSRTSLQHKQCFAAGMHCESAYPDPVLTRVYQPFFRSVPRWCEALWPLQHGRVQLYLVYIVATVLAVFFVEALRQPDAPLNTPAGTVAPQGGPPERLP